ncbi:MAG: bifunctional adenosylcobinamide kinase/adenosylcobinamide-phosphate guanylyltransferase [Candidatus Pacebacteria bacterium]|nr:bifunctional adenosylcobinamide kinase/adenosylcobinamide-phosphate guanylyltransferase [Candidatus Paceibacterota bacterium]
MAKQSEKQLGKEKKAGILQEAIDEIKQRFGDGAIMMLKEVRKVDVDVIPTGSIALDLALGVGGIPRGRVIEIFGPESSGKTSLALHIAAEAQKKGGSVAFVDAEHALDPEYAKKIGVKIQDLLISQPDSGEQALQIVETLVKSEAVDVVIIDSVAALTPRAEIEGEMGQLQIGLQARMMSQACRKLAGLIAKTKTAVIFINQTRMKIGCFQYNTRVVMEDGSTKKIGYLVNNKIQENILTYNLKNKKIESKPIMNWFRNGNAEHFIQFILEKYEGNGSANFACTSNHKILTSSGYKRAKDIKIGDKALISIDDWQPTQVQKEFIKGGLLGDGCIRHLKNKVKFQYRETHCKEQDNYIRWKSDYFNRKTIGRHVQGGLYLETFLSTALKQNYYNFYQNNKKVQVSESINLTPLILAIWHQDDGYFANQDRKAIVLSTNSFNFQSIRRLQIALKKQFDIETGVKFRKNGNELELTLGRKETKKFFDICAHLIHPSTRYKVTDEYKNIPFISPHKKYEFKKRIVLEAIVKDKYIKPKTRSMQKFDIETENHNYLVDGVIVHNSYGNPETTPGGLALKFYSSVRINLRRSAQIKFRDRIIGNRVIAKIVKNKVAAPFRVAEFDIYYNEGISQTGDVIRAGVENKVVKQAGAWYQFGDKKLGQGMEGAKEFLKENPEMMKEIKKAIMESIKQSEV